jgi:hypothetical protein
VHFRENLHQMQGFEGIFAESENIRFFDDLLQK